MEDYFTFSFSAKENKRNIFTFFLDRPPETNN